MWHSFISYLKFLLKSSNQHGVHSPFVYKLITECLYNKYNFDDYQKIKAYRKSLLVNRNKISIVDFGSGSRKFKTDERPISQMVKHSGTTLIKAKLLYRLVDYFKPKNSLELGTSLGIGTFSLALNQNENKVTTIEGCPNTLAIAKQQLQGFGITNINFTNSEFSKAIDSIVSENTVGYDLIYFDGNHQKDATLEYFDKLLSTAHNSSLWIFDDIYWSKDMTSAWETIKQHPKVTVIVDVFHYGLVFFRNEQPKQDFKIRL